MNKLLFTFLSFGLTAAVVMAQSSPAIRPLGERATWVMTLAQTESHPQSAPAPASPAEPASVLPTEASANSLQASVVKSMETTKYNGLVRDVILYVDGKRMERWYINGYDLLQHSNGYISVLDVVSNDQAPRYGGYTDFPDLRWVGKETFVGPANLDDRRVNYYRAASGDEAWIDAATQRPVKVTREGRTYTYAFSTTTPSALVMPEAFRKRYDDYLAPARNAVHYQMKR